MSNIITSFNDRIEYTLKCSKLEPIIITEPVGWKDDQKEYERHTQYHGIIAKFSNSLKFIGTGADYIQFIYDIYGINEEIELIRKERHPLTDVWTLTYSGYLDLSTWEREKNRISIKFNSGGIEQLIKSRESESVEVDRLTTLDGKAIPELQTINVELDGRRIFLKTKYEVKENENTVLLGCNSDDGNIRNQSCGIPLQLINKSHSESQNVIPQTTGDEIQGQTGMMFFAQSERVRVLKIKGKITFKSILSVFGSIDNARVQLCLTRYVGSDYLTAVGLRTVLFNWDTNYPAIILTGLPITINIDTTIVLQKGESLALEFFQKVDFNDFDGSFWRTIFYDIKSELYVDENSFQEKSKTQAVLYHELGDRLATILTNKKDVFYSDFLGRKDLGYEVDGKASYNAVAHGFWVREFDKLPIPSETPKVENLFKPLTTSFKDYADSLSAVWNTGVGIEKFGFVEKIRIEELSYFYNFNIVTRLPNQVKNVKRSVASEKYYSALNFGYEKGGDYEEACGLDEPNAKSNFTTIINRVKNVYSKISKYRADSYGMEFARRKSKKLNDTEDSKYDDDIWFLDLKFLNGIFKQRKWQDDLEEIPTGIFSPETATNLRLSPLNCLLRHSWWFGGCFKKYELDSVRYASSTANSQLTTKLIGKPKYAENGNILNSELQRARFIPEEIEFEHVCDFFIMQKINGKTNILGKEIPNFYGLFEFENERNELERGFLINLKPNGKGKWKLIKANR